MLKLSNIARFVFANVAINYDLKLSSNFKDISARQAKTDFDMLVSKIERLRDEIVQPDMYGEGAIELFNKLHEVFFEKITPEDVQNDVHRKKTFSESLDAVEWAFDEVQEKYPDDEQVQKIRAPFNLLRDWHDNGHPESHAFAERTVRRLGDFPTRVIAGAVLPPKVTMILSFYKMAKQGKMAILRL
jgi:hypothetical protein